MNNKTDLIEKQREYIDRICERQGITYTELARQCKVASTTITRLFQEDAEHALSSSTLAKISRRYNAEPTFINIGKVRVIGEAGAGAKVEIYAIEQTYEEIEAPQEAVEEGAVALRISGNSMYPVYKDGEYIIYKSECDYDSSYLGKDCVVELEDGRIFVKILQKGITKGCFTLASYNEPPMENVIIKWACPIKWTKKY